jgi:glycine/D-amino acid oxidase-like deaminating enzyme
MRLDDGFMQLRHGASLWLAQQDEPPPPPSPAGRHLRTDVVVVGGGITGSFLAERLTREGLRTVVIDRHPPNTGSTAASTALLLWELDTPLIELDDKLGSAPTQGIARLCRSAVAVIGRLCVELGIECDFQPQNSIYLAGDRLDPSALREEHRLRQHLNYEGHYLDCEKLDRMQVRGDAALLYSGAAEANPLALSNGLLRTAINRGATVLTPATAISYDTGAKGVVVQTDTGVTVSASSLILANGYEMPDFAPSNLHRIVSTWVLATAPVSPERPWIDDALMWEAADPYLYARNTRDGRIMAGGADEDVVDPDQRDAMLPQKIECILEKLSRRWKSSTPLVVDYAWSAFFGTTRDGLPLIGPVPKAPNCYAAFGYGGNGITFSAIAAELLAAVFRGEHPRCLAHFSLERDG